MSAHTYILKYARTYDTISKAFAENNTTINKKYEKSQGLTSTHMQVRMKIYNILPLISLLPLWSKYTFIYTHTHIYRYIKEELDRVFRYEFILYTLSKYSW